MPDQARTLDVQLLSTHAAPEEDTEEADLEACSGGGGLQLVPPDGYGCRSVLFCWVYPLLRQVAAAGRLELSDLFALPPEAKPEPLFEAFAAEWRRSSAPPTAAAAPGGRRPRKPGRTLLGVLVRIHVPGLWLLWLGRLVQALLDFSFPFFLNLLTQFVTDEDSPAWWGLTLAVLYLLLQLISVLIDNNVAMGMQSLGLRMRSSLISAICRKLLVLRQDALASFSTGKLNNLITTDVDKAKRVVRLIHNLFISPMKVTIALVSLYRLVGVSVLIGLAWMAVVILLNQVTMCVQSKLEDRQQSKTDERVRKATETISAIQVIKCYAWEEPAKAKVEEARKVELLAMWRLYCLYTVSEGLWSSVSPVATAVMFASYSWLNPDQPLTAAKAFTAIALLGMVQDPLFVIPYVLNVIVEALVAAKRLERLFFLPEAQLPSTACIGSFCGEGHQPPSGGEAAAAAFEGDPHAGPADGSLSVHLRGESFEWPRGRRRREGQGGDGGEQSEGEDQGEDEEEEEEEEQGAEDGQVTETRQEAEFRLADLQLSVRRGSLVVVVGATASGKSSLLQALLGEMPCAPSGRQAGREDGIVNRKKPIAFSPQQAWIFNATIRQNILFGEPFVQSRYDECLRCCELTSDLAGFPDGDLTKVGEKGIALSGGQKARVCLARAAYRQRNSSVFLLDDPYSALDAHVAHRVHQEAVLGLLAGKTRVVATNRLEFASTSDAVVVLDAGRVAAVGRYDDVRRRCEPLRGLLEAQGLELGAEQDDSGDAQVPAGRQLSRALSRALSATSAGSAEEPPPPGGEDAAAQGPEDEEEARATGQIRKEVIFYYLRSMGGPVTVSFLAAMYITSEVLNLLMPVWVANWTKSAPTADELSYYIVVYVVLSVFSIIFMALRDMTGNVLGFRAARKLHAAMFSAVLRAPMSFFQDTPQGRITNRFSKDISEIDKDLVWQLIYTVVPVLSVLGNFALVGGLAYFALLAFLPAFWLYYRCWKYYNRAALDIKRISKVTSSPVYDHFSNLSRENAVSIVRAHYQVGRECAVNNRLILEQQRPEYSQIYVELWFCMCVESLGSVFVFAVAVFTVLGRGRLCSPSGAALALTFAGECSGSIQSLIGQIAEFGMAFNCVERVMEYSTQLPSEKALTTEVQPEPGWPSRGVLDVGDLRLRYRPEKPPVLKGISFCTLAGERLGIVGRTGAGKSSLLLALLRIVEPEEGSILRLDEEDLLAMGLQDLRSSIAMIPQEPVLFQESLRYNCDPFSRYSAAAIWRALQEAQLAPWVLARASGQEACSEVEQVDAKQAAEPAVAPSSTSASTPMVPAADISGVAHSEEALEKMLRLEIKEGGQNLSAGQRQMVAIARAVLRESRLVVLDEATAAVDAATDAAIQLAIRRCFTGATTLTIAHRLQTIMDSDRILVLSAGEVAELGPPSELQAREGGTFASMVAENAGGGGGAGETVPQR